MSSIASVFGVNAEKHPLRDAFLKWQCRARQMSMRDNEGRPDDAITPAVILAGQEVAMGHIITVINKAPSFSVTPELQHMSRKTHDPAQRREAALRFFAAGYYQKASEFSDILTATFPPGSQGAQTIRDAERATLVFEAFAQKFTLDCKVWRLAENNPLNQSTMAHNLLFNPTLPPDTIVLGFEPDWSASSSTPEFS